MVGLLVGSGLLVSCFERPAGGPPLGYETDVFACSDLRDNDRDGRVDCLDSDCLAGGFCEQIIPLSPPNDPESDFDACRDRIDNDGDGQFDCGDRDCQAINELCCVSEFTNDLCDDGIDNDGNGFADCADFACRNGPFVDVCGRERDCRDGQDNDDDNFTDCEDRDCQGTAACPVGNEDSAAACQDGFDNDEDDDVDCADEDCFETGVCPPEGPEESVVTCQDGADNDRDGFTDCDDFDCSRSDDPAVSELCETTSTGDEEDTLEECQDGLDNDQDGFTDCNDFSCSMGSPDVLAMCREQNEAGLEKCSDGIDNDGNGFTDCDDNDCVSLAIYDSFAEYSAVVAYCVSLGREGLPTRLPEECESTPECPAGARCIAGGCVTDFCHDGIDNDGNGFADCADFRCRGVLVTFSEEEEGFVWSNSCLESIFPIGDDATFEGENVFGVDVPTISEQSLARDACTDGIDNDLDGFSDCFDWDCAWNPLTREICKEFNPVGVCE